MNINITNIIENIKQIEATPCHSTTKDGFINNDRVDCIDKIIKDSGCEYYHIKGKKYYRLYGKYDLETLKKKYNNVCLVSAHADNLQEQSSFREIDNDKINGCFDNSATIGCALTLMTKASLPDNVLFVFTSCEEEDEEDCYGAKRASKKINEYFDNVEEITLDVTYGFRKGVDFTFENDFLRRNITNKEDLREMFDSFHDSNFRWDCVFAKKNNNKYITVPELKELMREHGGKTEESDGDDDESHIYKKKFSSFSFCLPCSAEDNDEMHDPKGFVISKNTLVRYTLALYTALSVLRDNNK